MQLTPAPMAPARAAEDRLAYLFAALDDDENRVLTRLEWAQEDRGSLRGLFDCADKNRDDKVQLQDLVAALRLGEANCASRSDGEDQDEPEN